MKNIILKYYKNILIILLAVIATVFIGLSDKRKDEIINLKAKNTLLTQSIDTFRNKNNQLIYEQEIATYTNDKIIKELSDEVFDLKRKNSRLVKQVNYYGSINQEIIIDSIFVPYIDTIYEQVDSMIKVPRYFSKITPEYTLDGIVLKSGVELNKFQMYNTISYRSIEKSNGWFKQPTTTLQVINSNPHVIIKGMTSTEVKHEVSAWYKWILPTLTAIGTGATIYYITK